MYGTLNFLSTKRFNMNLCFFSHYKTRCLISIYISPALPILIQIHRIYHSTESGGVTRTTTNKWLGNKNLYRTATENKRNKTQSQIRSTVQHTKDLKPRVLKFYKTSKEFRHFKTPHLSQYLRCFKQCLESRYLTGKNIARASYI